MSTHVRVHTRKPTYLNGTPRCHSNESNTILPHSINQSPNDAAPPPPPPHAARRGGGGGGGGDPVAAHRRQLRRQRGQPPDPGRRGHLPGHQDHHRPRQALRRQPGLHLRLRGDPHRPRRLAPQLRAPGPRRQIHGPRRGPLLGPGQPLPLRAGHQRHAPPRRQRDPALHRHQPHPRPPPRHAPPRAGAQGRGPGRRPRHHPALPRHPRPLRRHPLQRHLPRGLQHQALPGDAPVPPRHGVAVYGQPVPLLQLQPADAQLRAVPPQRRHLRPGHRAQLHQHVRRADGRRVHRHEEARLRRRRPRRRGGRVAHAGRGRTGRRRGAGGQGLQPGHDPGLQQRQGHAALARQEVRDLPLLPLRREPEAGANRREAFWPLQPGLHPRLRPRAPQGWRLCGSEPCAKPIAEPEPQALAVRRREVVRRQDWCQRDGPAEQHQLRLRLCGLQGDTERRRVLRPEQPAVACLVRDERLLPGQPRQRLRLRLQGHGHRHLQRPQLRELQVRLLTVRSKPRQCEGGGASLEPATSSSSEPRRRQRRWTGDTARLAPHSSMLVSDSHASFPSFLVISKLSMVGRLLA